MYSIATQVEQNPVLKEQLSESVSIAKYVICNYAIDIVTKAMQVVGDEVYLKKTKSSVYLEMFNVAALIRQQMMWLYLNLQWDYLSIRSKKLFNYSIHNEDSEP